MSKSLFKYLIIVNVRVERIIVQKPVKLQLCYLHESRNSVSPMGTPRKKGQDYKTFQRGYLYFNYFLLISMEFQLLS